MKLKYLKGNDYLVAYNTNTMKMFRFRGDITEVLPDLLPEDYTELDKQEYLEEVNQVTNEDFKQCLMGLVEECEYNFYPSREVVTISFAPVHKCNMHCNYCFADSGENYQGTHKEMSEETLKRIFEFIFQSYAPDCSYVLVSLVSGGEPFLNLDIVAKINKIIDSIVPNMSRKIFVGTNMTLYNEQISQKLKEINPQLGVSIDGAEHVHNRNRIFANGEGTYRNVVHNLKTMKEDSNLSTKTKNCIFMSVITEDNLDLIDILKHHKSLGATSVQMRVARSKESSQQGITEKNVERFIDAYKKLSDFLLNEFKESRTNYLNMILNSTDCFGRYIKRILLNEFTNYRCGAGRDKLSFTAEGDIYPCDSFLGNEKFCLGNVYRDKGIDERFYTYSLMNNKKCNECWAKFICTGDCPYNSYVRTGQVDEPDEVMCKFYRALSEIAILLIQDMSVCDKQQFNSLIRKLQIREKNNKVL